MYLITEDITVKEKEFSSYEILNKIFYDIDLENPIYEKEVNFVDYFIYGNKTITFCHHDVFSNEILNDLYKSEFICIKRFFQKHNWRKVVMNKCLFEWFNKFEELFNFYKDTKNIFIYFDIEKKEFVVFKLIQKNKHIYFPLTFLPIVDDRLFSYGISNIQSLYFPKMNIGNVNPDIYTSLFTDVYKKEDIFEKQDYEKAITLNEFIEFIDKYINLSSSEGLKDEFFDSRKDTFKYQLDLLKPYQETNGHKKIFSFILV